MTEQQVTTTSISPTLTIPEILENYKDALLTKNITKQVVATYLRKAKKFIEYAIASHGVITLTAAEEYYNEKLKNKKGSIQELSYLKTFLRFIKFPEKEVNLIGIREKFDWPFFTDWPEASLNKNQEPEYSYMR